MRRWASRGDQHPPMASGLLGRERLWKRPHGAGAHDLAGSLIHPTADWALLDFDPLAAPQSHMSRIVVAGAEDLGPAALDIDEPPMLALVRGPTFRAKPSSLGIPRTAGQRPKLADVVIAVCHEHDSGPLGRAGARMGPACLHGCGD